MAIYDEALFQRALGRVLRSHNLLQESCYCSLNADYTSPIRRTVACDRSVDWPVVRLLVPV